MYAIVETSGRQFRVEPGHTVTVDRLAAEVGSTVTLERVLLVGGDDVKVGTPTVAGATVKAKVVSHERGEKMVTFKYRHRARHRRRVGSRALLTTLAIESIDLA